MYHFFAFMSRMRYIRRWGLMRNTQSENIQEHSLQVAMVAHCLAVIGNRYYGRQYDPEHIMALAVYHETSEILTGDLATPIKYANPELRDAYKAMEELANRRLLKMLPEELKPDYEPLILQDEKSEEHRIVKAADRVCAYLKCVEELRSGNGEFADAAETIRADIERLDLPEVRWFMKEMVPSFSLTLDRMKDPC